MAASEKQRRSLRKHYANNKDYYIEKAKRLKESKRRFLNAVKSYPCEDCGIGFPSCAMQFDHRKREDKLFTPSTLINKGWPKLIDEIMKCDVVCANCHAVRTHGCRKY